MKRNGSAHICMPKVPYDRGCHLWFTKVLSTCTQLSILSQYNIIAPNSFSADRNDVAAAESAVVIRSLIGSILCCRSLGRIKPYYQGENIYRCSAITFPPHAYHKRKKDSRAAHSDRQQQTYGIGDSATPIKTTLLVDK